MASLAPLPPAAEAVLTFLESIGKRTEAELYVRLFRQLPAESFAVIVAEAAVVEHALGSLVEQLRFLSELGLHAPVVLGLLHPEEAEHGRMRLAEQLPREGLRVANGTLGEAGVVERTRAQLRGDVVPLLCCPPGGDVGHRLELLGALGRGLDSRKIVVLRRRGGLGPHGESRIELAPGHILPTQGGGISMINLSTDHETLLQSGLLTTQEVTLLQHLRELLQSEPLPNFSVHVASPLSLFRELFTVRGAGTLVKRGTPICRYDSYQPVGHERLCELFKTSFGRTLRPSFFERPLLSLYVAEGVRGAAVVEPTPVAPFLTKFAVDPIAQGEGIGQDLWQAMRRDHASLFWRARSDNAILPWYTALADGLVRLPRWHVFWRGVSPESVPAVVRYALSREEDFENSTPPPVGSD